MGEPSTGLQSASPTVVDRMTGDVLSVREASTEQLAEFLVNQQCSRALLNEAEEMVAAEILDRLDRAASWTLRVGVLRTVLTRLVEADEINGGAAANALRRTLTLELAVPWDANLAMMADSVRQAVEIHVASVKVTVLKAEPASRVSAVGIKVLRKVPGVSEKLEGALAVQSPPKRRVKVTRST
jgi:hypothetical protein